VYCVAPHDHDAVAVHDPSEATVEPPVIGVHCAGGLITSGDGCASFVGGGLPSGPTPPSPESIFPPHATIDKHKKKRTRMRETLSSKHGVKGARCDLKP
jgi:hypothetical protein